MNVDQAHHDNQDARHRLVAEVIELGESLFEMALEVGTYQPAVGEEIAVYPVEEIQAAAADFFTALRLLLGIAG